MRWLLSIIDPNTCPRSQLQVDTEQDLNPHFHPVNAFDHVTWCRKQEVSSSHTWIPQIFLLISFHSFMSKTTNIFKQPGSYDSTLNNDLLPIPLAFLPPLLHSLGIIPTFYLRHPHIFSSFLFFQCPLLYWLCPLR